MNRKLPLTEAEKQVESTSFLVDIQKDNFGWLDDKEFHDFLDSWWNLAKSYQAEENTVINVDVVGIYLRWIKELEKISEKASDTYKKEQAAMALNNLEGCMFEIQKESSRTLNNIQ